MPKLYEALAEAFLAEGVDTQFVLMGDGNMHWSTTLAKLPGVDAIRLPGEDRRKRREDRTAVREWHSADAGFHCA